MNDAIFSKVVAIRFAGGAFNLPFTGAGASSALHRADLPSSVDCRAYFYSFDVISYFNSLQFHYFIKLSYSNNEYQNT